MTKIEIEVVVRVSAQKYIKVKLNNSFFLLFPKRYMYLPINLLLAKFIKTKFKYGFW